LGEQWVSAIQSISRVFAAKFERASWLSPNGKSVLIFRLLARR